MPKLKNNKPIIGFDMDGVILDETDVKIRVAKKLGFNLKLHHTPYSIMKTILPQSVVEELIKMLNGDHKLSITIPLMRGIKTILAGLQKRRIPIYLISRRRMPEAAIKTLSSHGIWPKYFNKNNSFFVLNPEDKNKQAAKLGITHYIDDELKIINVLSKVPNKFLFDRYNAFEDADHYTKIKSWSEFKKHINLT